MTFEPLTPEQRTALASFIGEDAKPAEIGLVLSLGESVRDAREHDHTTQREDWFCMNLTSFMGERMGPVLRRLLDLEAEQQTLNEALSNAAEKLRADQEPTSSFFRPGRAYTRDLPFRAPEDRPNFECVGVAVHPTKGVLRAFGFEQPGNGRPWASSALSDEAWADGWVDLGPVRPDRLTRAFAPTQALAEDQEADK
ncbi:hypothetical protein [Streptomyces europaeiscabiei]|uniref:hypothetical protein n=1 Tax=Streptomyces europaeiscabiei TaxID=146819 RepID=UPI000765F9E9|nr:hypothetical protein [Streptomyces europaeiscabiei]MDX3831342.1 hypothetical protein [Streptomyces europaeiscabiei]